MRYINRTSGLILLLGVSVFLLIYVLDFTPNIPMSDQWELVPLLRSVSLQDLWRQHNEHRIFIPKLIYLGLAHLSRWNIRWETATSLFFFSALILLIWSKFSSYNFDRMSRCVFLAALVAELSPIHHENLLWGWQLQLMLCVLAVFIAMMNVEEAEKGLRPLLIMVSALFVATLSFLSGIFGWAICFVVMLWMKRYKLSNLFLFLLAGIGTGFLYFIGYIAIKSQQAPVSLLNKAIEIISYFFVYMGANFIPTYKVGRLITPLLWITGLWGLIFLLLGAFLLIKTMKYDRSKTVIPYSMMLFSLLTSAATSIGRNPFGIQFALLSRYHAFQMFYFIGFVWLLLIFIEEENKLKAARRYMIILFALLILTNWTSGIALGIIKNRILAPVIKDIKENGAKIAESSAVILCNNNSELRNRIGILKELKYNVFSR